MMDGNVQASGSKSDEPARIYYQSFVDPQEQRPYMLQLQETLTAYASRHVSFEVHGVSPPDRYLSPLTEFRCADRAIRDGIGRRTGKARRLDWTEGKSGYFKPACRGLGFLGHLPL
jgi:hypothetical protein